MKTLRKLNKWFELKFGWFFINGRKRGKYNNYLEDKYKTKSKPPKSYPGRDIFI